MDELPKKPISGMSLIVNMEPSTEDGSHWVCLKVFPDKIFYFDAFGMPPHETLKKWMKSYGKETVYNTSQVQHIQSHRCGYYCAYVINELSKGIPIYDILYKLNQEPSKENEKIIDTYYKKL